MSEAYQCEPTLVMPMTAHSVFGHLLVLVCRIQWVLEPEHAFSRTENSFTFLGGHYIQIPVVVDINQHQIIELHVICVSA